MKVTRKFIKIFFILFAIFLFLTAISWFFEFYYLYMGRILAGFFIFLGILAYNKSYPILGAILTILLFLAVIAGIIWMFI